MEWLKALLEIWSTTGEGLNSALFCIWKNGNQPKVRKGALFFTMACSEAS